MWLLFHHSLKKLHSVHAALVQDIVHKQVQNAKGNSRQLKQPSYKDISNHVSSTGTFRQTYTNVHHKIEKS